MTAQNRKKSVVWVRGFGEVDMDDVGSVGGKNASLGEMYQKLTKENIDIPYGFALTADAYRQFLEANKLEKELMGILKDLNTSDVKQLKRKGKAIRKVIMEGELPSELIISLNEEYRKMCSKYKVKNLAVAVRSSATAEDLPGASFAGQQESFLNIRGIENLAKAVKRCYASLFTDRAISYRVDKGFNHMDVAISVGVQKMVRSDLASAGVMFTADPESGFRNAVVIHSSYGLGENVVKGRVDPDEFMVFKESLKNKKDSIIQRRNGNKKNKIVFNPNGRTPTKKVDVKKNERLKLSLEDGEVTKLAKWGLKIQHHYKMPMDIEWAKDGKTGKLMVVQARPMTGEWLEEEKYQAKLYSIKTSKKPLVTGWAVGRKVAAGKVAKIQGVHELSRVKEDQVLVTRMTDPDWEPVMKIASAIVTDEGGKTCHAAIVSRELGIPCVVGAKDATKKLGDGDMATVSCAEGEIGKVYKGEVKFSTKTVSIDKLPKIPTDVMLNIGEPEIALGNHWMPVSGVGLARIEFILANHVKIHPMAAIRFNELDKELRNKVKKVCQDEAPVDYYVRVLKEGVSKIAAGFYPKDIILRFSDFKSNEYSQLVGGWVFEPDESNPMIGYRGASRYYDEGFEPAFRLECRAIHKVRKEMGLTNAHVMIPFCRSPDELKKVIKIMEEENLKRKKGGMKLFVMAEVPSNILIAEEFAKLVDGFSIGTNDLTQMTYGVDRDSQKLAHLQRDTSVPIKRQIATLIKKAHKNKCSVGICGEAPSNDLDFAHWLVSKKIDSISLESDSIIPFLLKMKKAS